MLGQNSCVTFITRRRRGYEKRLTLYPFPLYRGQYSDAVLSELENQNDMELEGMSGKVKMLKEVRLEPQ